MSYCIANYSRRIASDLSELSNAPWIPLAGTLSDAVSQPLYGYFAQSLGRERPVIFASSTLTLAFLTCFISVWLWQLVVGRIIFGIGSSGISLLAIVMLTDVIPLASVPLWRSVLVIGQNLGLMSGGPLGSYIAATTNWHVPFLIESVLATCATTILLLAFKRVVKETTSSLARPLTGLNRLDKLGLTILPLLILAPVAAITLGENVLAWDHPLVIALLAMFIPLLVVFVYVEGKVAVNPLLPPRIFKSWQTIGVLICTALSVWARNQVS